MTPRVEAVLGEVRTPTAVESAGSGLGPAASEGEGSRPLP